MSHRDKGGSEAVTEVGDVVEKAVGKDAKEADGTVMEATNGAEEESRDVDRVEQFISIHWKVLNMSEGFFEIRSFVL